MGPAGPEAALAKDSLTVDLSAGLQGSTNANLGSGGSSTVGGLATAAANYRIAEERTTLDLGASGSASTYFNGQSSDLSAGVSADLQHRASERLSVQLFGHYSYSQSNGSGYLLLPAGLALLPPGTVLAPGTPTSQIIITPPPTGTGAVLPPDVTVLGRRLTQKSFGGGGSLQWRLSPRTSLFLSASANRQTYNDPLLSSYRSFGQSATLTRQVSESTSVFGQFQISEIRYDNGEHDTIMTPMIGVTRQLNRIFSASVSGGASIVHSRLPDGTRFHSSTLAMAANVCGKYEHSRLCFNASRQETPTSLGGVRPQTSASVIYADQRNANDTLTLTGQFDRSGRDSRRIFPAQSSAAGTARYDHRLSDRLSLFGSAQYIRIWQSGAPGRSDLRGAVGIALRLGEKG
ncbi:MAG TPA: hypothetical protein VFP14_07395 [Novosphingobium sp.]|nr:hypothetical protein [Novosphingobium sp.]